MLSALLLAAKLIYTGVVVLVPSAESPSLVRVVVPNGRTPQGSIPSHIAYVMFRMDQWDKMSRKPDLILTDPVSKLKLGVCFLNEEHLTVNGSFQSTALCQPTESTFPVKSCTDAQPMVTMPFPSVVHESLVTEEDSLHWLLDLSRANPNIETKIKDDVLQDNPQGHDVALRMNLTVGRLTVLPQSFDLRYGYRLKRDGTCQALARAVVVTMDDTSNPSTLNLASTSFTGVSKKLALKLSTTLGEDVVVLIGNEPRDHIRQAVNLYLGAPPSEHHEDTTNHLRLIERLLQDTTLIVPREIPAGACQDGLSPEVTVGSAGGDGGTCNPSGMPAKDPAGIGK